MIRLGHICFTHFMFINTCMVFEETRDLRTASTDGDGEGWFTFNVPFVDLDLVQPLYKCMETSISV